MITVHPAKKSFAASNGIRMHVMVISSYCLACLLFTGKVVVELEEDEKTEVVYEMPKEAAVYEVPVSSGTVSFIAEAHVRLRH